MLRDTLAVPRSAHRAAAADAAHPWFRRKAYKRGQKDASGLGFKIALELYVKCRVQDHGEVQIFFSKRLAGESKLDSKVMVYYIRHLIDLYR